MAKGSPKIKRPDAENRSDRFVNRRWAAAVDPRGGYRYPRVRQLLENRSPLNTPSSPLAKGGIAL
jgi:hypothetical protein